MMVSNRNLQTSRDLFSGDMLIFQGCKLREGNSFFQGTLESWILVPARLLKASFTSRPNSRSVTSAEWNPPRPSPTKTVALKGTNWYPAMFGLGLKHGNSNSWQILGNLWNPLLNFRGTLDGIMDAEAVDIQHIQFQISTIYTLHTWNTSLLIPETIMAMATSFRTEPSSNCSKVHKRSRK